MLRRNSWSLLLLLLPVACCVALNGRCPNGTDPQYQLDLAQPPAALLPNSIGSLAGLYTFAQAFLRAVQPNEFPLDIATRSLRGEEQTLQIVRYEAGYLVCLILAVLYVLIIPVVGGVLVWRHFHHKSVPVSRRPSSSSSSPWYKRDVTVITCLSVVVILLFTGVILAFITNDRLHQNMQPNLSQLRSDITDIETALTSVPQKVKTLIDEFSIFRTELEKELNGTGAFISKTLLSSLEDQIQSTLTALNLTIQDATNAQRYLQEVQQTNMRMQPTYSYLKKELQDMRKQLSNLKSNCGAGCDVLNATNLDTDANYEMIPSVEPQLTKMNFMSGFSGAITQVKATILSITENCTDMVTPQINTVVVNLDMIEKWLSNYSHNLPSLSSLSRAVSDIRKTFDQSRGGIVYYDNVRWSLSVVLCTLILIIVLLMLAGLVTGVSLVAQPTLYPFHMQDLLRKTAVCLLRVAAGMTFIFSWLFIIMVFINLFFGGNAHTLGCRSYTHGQIFDFLDTLDLFNSLDSNTDSYNLDMSQSFYNISSTTQTPRPGTNSTTSGQTPVTGTNSTTSGQVLNITFTPGVSGSPTIAKPIKTFEIYQGCMTGMSMFYSLHMDETFNMEHFVNASLYLIEIKAVLQDLTVDLSDVTLVPNDITNLVTFFRDSSDLDKLNFDGFKEQLKKEVMQRDLEEFAKSLETTAGLGGNEAIRENLTREALKARQLLSSVQILNTNRTSMNSSIAALAKINQTYKTNANNALQNSEMLKSNLTHQLPVVVQNVSQCITERGDTLLSMYLNRLRHGILYEALDCHWLPVAVANIYMAACKNLISPWNAFWLSLGWCCAFLVPGLIFSILMARRWQGPSLITNKEPFQMPDDIISKPSCSVYVTMDDMRDKGSASEAESNFYKDEFKDFRKEDESSFNYKRLDDLMGFAAAKESDEKKVKWKEDDNF